MPSNYRRVFWKSRHHLWLALLTLGLGFATGEPLGLLGGATLYALGLVFLPDAGFFRRGIDAQEEAARQAEETAQLTAFAEQQARLLSALSTARRARYAQLGAVCLDIESASTEGQSATGLAVESRLRKLDELLWTYLRMLSIEQSLEVYLETERKEQVPSHVQSIEAETHTLAAEVQAARALPPPVPGLETKERLLTSRLERLDALKQRLARIEQSQANLDLVRAEQERLVEQVKLIRADAVAAKNTAGLTARIDSSIEHLASTNKWLSELSDFKDLTSEMPVLPPRGVSTPATGSRSRQPEPPAAA